MKVKSNEELQKDVQRAIKYEPLLHAAEIGVIVEDGVVTLLGTVDNYVKKVNAERAAKNVFGVKAIAENIIVDYGKGAKNSDTKIAKSILKAWKLNSQIPENLIQVRVDDGWVKLSGQVPWNYQKLVAQREITCLHGVKGVTNLIT